MKKFNTIITDDEKNTICIGMEDTGHLFNLSPASTTFDDFDDMFDEIFKQILPKGMTVFWARYKTDRLIGSSISRQDWIDVALRLGYVKESGINQYIKNMENDGQRLSFLESASEDICIHCGMVCDGMCHCMNDE